MFARVVTVQIKPGEIDEAVRIYQDAVIPAGTQQKGHAGFLLLTNRETGRGISVAMWETEADMKAGETSGYLQQQLGKFASVFAAPATTEHFEVSVRR